MNRTDEHPAQSAQTRMKGHRWFAANFDRMSQSDEKKYLGEMRRTLLAGATGDVLEIGAGTGSNFQHYTPDVKVSALEPDPFMAARAEAKIAAAGYTNITLQQSPAESLPFPDASFDTVVSTLVLCTVDDVDLSLREIRRVLRPGGKLLFIEHVRGDGAVSVMQAIIRPAWHWFAAGCYLNRTTEASLAANGWDVVIDERRRMSALLPAIRGHATPRT